MNKCGAKTRNGTPCKRRPRENGRCALHGGKSLKGIDHPNYKHGLYVEYANADIREKIERFKDADPFDLVEDLATQRALFATYLSKFVPGVPLSALDINYMMEWSAQITKTVERIAKIKNDSALTAAEVTFLAIRATEIVHRYIDDPEKRQAFIEDLFAGIEASDSAGTGEAQLLQLR